MEGSFPFPSGKGLGLRGHLLLSKLARSAIDLIFPINCTGCGREGGIICNDCAGGLPLLRPPYCRICAAPGADGLCTWCSQYPRGFESLRAPYQFEGAIREAVHALKYRGMRAAAETLGGLMTEYLQQNPVQCNVLVPVPLHSSRLRSRGYNQSALLAREIGRRLDIPVQEDLLERLINAGPQVESQTREERRSNVAGNFACKSDATGQAVLLIDDVATTASTLSECAQSLKEAGASRTYALTLARDG